MENIIKIGIIGCGAIGLRLAQTIETKFFKQVQLCAVCDKDEHKVKKLKAKISANPQIVSIEELINISELVIEAAATEVSYKIAKAALECGKDVIIMSVGGILDHAEQLFSLARKKYCHIYLPSGAIAGLDVVKAGMMAKINKVTLVTRKPPEGLAGAPYLVENNIDLSDIKQETVIFEGVAL